MVRSGDTAVQGQTAACCECGSVVVPLCRVYVCVRVCGLKMAATRDVAPWARNICAQTCKNFRSSSVVTL
jgi:hypothetical protein